MKIARFNLFSIQKLKAKAKVYDVQVDDCKGLALRINPKGTISLLYRFQLSGRRRKMSIGTFSRDNLKKAKIKYEGAVKQVEANIDPLAERAQKQNDDDNPLFKNFAERFLDNHVRAKLRPRTIADYTRHVNKYFVPVFGNIHLADIEKRQIIKLIERLAKDAPIQANRKLATLKKLFSYAVDVDVLKINPATGIKPPSEEKVKDRVLEEEELAKLFRFLESYKNRDTADILRLIALTAQRPGEVLQMQISQLKAQPDGTWWHLSSAETKNKKKHQVFINDQALQIIQRRIIERGLDQFIFPATKLDGTKTHTRGDVLVKLARRILPLVKDVEEFSAHDLRRSAATGIAKIGFGAVVADILNHTPQGITRRIYDKYSRQPEIKAALTAWGETLQRAIDGNQADVIEINSMNK